MPDPLDETSSDSPASRADDVGLRPDGPPAGRATLPTGTVTFLMTDIEGSTRLLQALPDEYPELLAAHHRLLREASGSAGGIEASVEGDALFFAFEDVRSAIRAAIEGQQRLAGHAWPQSATVRVRMGIHSGEGRLLGGEYVGLDVHRTARIVTAGHGGQVLVSDAARGLAEGRLATDASFRDLGEHRLKDIDRSEHLFQLAADGLATEFPPLRSLTGRPNNLPAQMTSFVGRDLEKQQLLEHLGASRLLTLTGPGGTGKSRLSLEVAAASLDRFADGVYFVPLATISDPELLVITLASTLGVREGSARPVREGLIEYLRDRTILLVLDNFEQLLTAAPTVAELLAGAPRLRVLASSREALRIAGEQEYPVRPLAVPDSGGVIALEELEQIDSVALFVQRARSVKPDFHLAPETARVVSEICTRLDGLPLAIELAAARSGLFEPAEILARLDRRLAFLAGGRDVPERQRTLRGAIDWSHELLDEAEQVLFRRLAVFAGGCTLEAVEAVCEPHQMGLEAVDGVSSLHDKSLLRRDGSGGGSFRVAMLETIREYARERLHASGEAADFRRRHAEFFLDLAQQAAGHLHGRDQGEWFEILDGELDNVRAVIGWALDSGEAAIGIRLAASLEPFWVFRNHAKEGRRHLDELLASPLGGIPLAARAAGMGAAAGLAVWQGDYGVSRSLAEQSLSMYRELGDLAGIAGQLSSLGYASVIPDPAAALELFRESIAAYREVGAPPMMGQSLIGMALPEMQFRKVGDAASHLEEAAAVFREAGDTTMSLISEGLLGLCARLEGDRATARRRYIDVLHAAQRTGAHIALTLPLAALADLALLEGDAERAAVLDSAQAQLTERLGGAPSFQLMGIPDVSERARADLGDERYEAAVASGLSASLEKIIALACEGPGRRRSRAVSRLQDYDDVGMLEQHHESDVPTLAGPDG